MELNKENMKKIRWLITFSVLLYLGVQNLDVVLKYAKIVWGLLLPFVLGGAMAFVLNVPMAFIERHVFGKAKEKEDRRGRAAAKFARPVSLIFSIVLVVLAILVVVLIVAPELGRTLVNVVKKVEEDIPLAQKWLTDTFQGFCTEMEGAAIAQAAYLNGIPFLIVRAISDKADDSASMDYPEFERQAILHSTRLTKALIEAY